MTINLNLHVTKYPHVTSQQNEVDVLDSGDELSKQLVLLGIQGGVELVV